METTNSKSSPTFSGARWTPGEARPTSWTAIEVRPRWVAARSGPERRRSLQDLDPRAPGVSGEEAAAVTPGMRVLGGGAGRLDPPAQRVEVVRDDAEVPRAGGRRVARGQVDLPGVQLEPHPPLVEFSRLGDLFEPERARVEGPRLGLRPRGIDDVDVLEKPTCHRVLPTSWRRSRCASRLRRSAGGGLRRGNGPEAAMAALVVAQGVEQLVPVEVRPAQRG